MDPSTRVRDTTAIAATASHIHELLYRVAVIEYVCLILCHKCESQLLRRSGRIWWNRLDPFVTGRRDRYVVYSYRVVSCLGRNSHLSFVVRELTAGARGVRGSRFIGSRDME